MTHPRSFIVYGGDEWELTVESCYLEWPVANQWILWWSVATFAFCSSKNWFILPCSALRGGWKWLLRYLCGLSYSSKHAIPDTCLLAITGGSMLWFPLYKYNSRWKKYESHFQPYLLRRLCWHVEDKRHILVGDLYVAGCSSRNPQPYLIPPKSKWHDGQTRLVS